MSVAEQFFLDNGAAPVPSHPEGLQVSGSAEVPAEVRGLVDELSEALAARRPLVAHYDRYYDGDHPLPGIPEKAGDNAKKEYRRLLKMSRTNFAKKVIDVPVSRMAVSRYTSGLGEVSDQRAWGWWQRSAMDADSLVLIRSALTTGQAFLTVWPGPDGEPVFSAEHAAQVIVAYEPGSMRARRAALKQWELGDSCYSVLYTPELVWKFQAGEDKRLVPWQPTSDDTWPIANPAKVVPVVECRVNPQLRPTPYGGGVSDLVPVIEVQNRITETVFARLVAQTYAAFKQKWVVGQPVEYDEQGKPKAPWELGPDRILTTSNPEARFGEFDATDLTNLLACFEADAHTLGILSNIPPYYLLGELKNIATETITASESGLITMIEQHESHLGEAIEEAFRVGWRIVDGGSPAADEASEIEWVNPETRSLAERVDAALKLKGLELPRRALWELLDLYTPTQIADMEVSAVLEALQSADVAPVPPAGVA